MPPLVVPVYHAPVSSTLPCPVVLQSSAMFPPVTSAPWKKTSLMCTAPPPASAGASMVEGGGRLCTLPHQPSGQGALMVGRVALLTPRVWHPCDLRLGQALRGVGHKPGGRWQPPAFTHPLVRAIAPAIAGVPAMALWSTMAFRVMLDKSGHRASVSIPRPSRQQVNNGN